MRLTIIFLIILFPGFISSQAKTQLESENTEVPLELLHNGNTILLLNNNAGLSLGTNLSAPAGGLRLQILDDGIDRPLRADGDGNIYKGTSLGTEFMSVHPACFNASYSGNPNGIQVGAAQPFIYCPLSLPNSVTLKKLKFCYQDQVSTGHVQVSLTRNNINNGTGASLGTVESTGSSGFGCKEISNLNILVDNTTYNYHLSAWATGTPLVDTYVIMGVVIEY